jgi:hypothetical protein
MKTLGHLVPWEWALAPGANYLRIDRHHNYNSYNRENMNWIYSNDKFVQNS